MQHAAVWLKRDLRLRDHAALHAAHTPNAADAAAWVGKMSGAPGR